MSTGGRGHLTVSSTTRGDRARRRTASLFATVGAIFLTLSSTSIPEGDVEAAACAPTDTAEDLDAFFSGDDAGGLAGADYPHAIDLPDGRTLWYFQDAFFGTGTRLDGSSFAHNAALIQTGDCFERLDAPGGDGDSWIGSWVETDLSNWLWPLDAELGADGHLWLFLAEVQNPNGDGAARGALPVGTWVARYTLPDLRLVGMEPAPDPSRSLFGYSVVSDSQWSYLYGHCYRQFDSAGIIGFDPKCSPHSYVARVPVGAFGDDLEYWTGSGWSTDRGERTPVFTSELSMPVSVERFGDVYVAASIEGDWFGDDLVTYTSPAPQGPWTESTRTTLETGCEACNNYGAFVLPDLEGDRVVIAHSNNAMDMTEAFERAELYRTGVIALDVPGVSAANLDRRPDLALALAEPLVDDTDRDDSATPVGPGSRIAPMHRASTAATPTTPSGGAPTALDPFSSARDVVVPTVLGRSFDPGTPAVVQRIATVAGLVVLVGAVALASQLATLTVLRAGRRARSRRREVIGRVRNHVSPRLHHA